MARQFDIVIVGSGLAGSSLALALSGQRLRVGVIEGGPLPEVNELPEPGLEGYDARVSALTPASQDFFNSLGVWQAIRELRVSPYRAMSVWDAEGSGQIDFHCDELAAPVLGHLVENRIIVSCLIEAIRQAGDIDLINPARLEGFEQDDNGVQVTLDNGQQLQAGLLVAADGALSKVRQLAGFQTREWDYGHKALAATVQTELDPEQTARQSFLSSGPLALLPMNSVNGKHYCSIVWSSHPELADELCELSEEAFCLRLERAFESRLGKILGTSKRIAFPLRQRHAVDYVQPHIALVADAAHTIHPLAGQGINLGLQDVSVLAEEILKANQRGEDLGSLAVLKRYQRRRKQDNLVMMAAMDGFKRLFEQDALPVRWLRNQGMGWMGAVPGLKKNIMRHAMGVR